MKSQAIKEVSPVNSPREDIYFKTYGQSDSPLLYWGHGWGQNHQAFEALINSLESIGHHTALDFHGFGQTPEPDDVWGTADYADHVAEFIRARTDEKIIWIGHSFGCRVGIQLAARHPDLIAGLFLIAGAGLKRYRPWHRKAILIKIRIYLYKTLKKLIPLGLNEDWLKSKFGSADYKNASGNIRNIFIKVVNEDLTEEAKTILCPVHLVYGADDTETPPEIGQRLEKLIPNAQLDVLIGQDHYSVLSKGRHQVAPLLKKFVERLQQNT